MQTMRHVATACVLSAAAGCGILLATSAAGAQESAAGPDSPSATDAAPQVPVEPAGTVAPGGMNEPGVAPSAQEPGSNPEPAPAAGPGPEPRSDAADDWGAFAASSEQTEAVSLLDTRIYGYVNSFFEQVGSTPATVGADGRSRWDSNPYAWDVLNTNIMVQGSIAQQYRYFVNLAADSGGHPGIDVSVTLRNAWVELPLWKDHVVFRVGKTYRRFGLYNEILDAIPTYVGVHPPEIFDDAHLMLTRTTNAMLHGVWGLGGDRQLRWSLATGMDERRDDQVPIGGDVAVGFGQALRIGASGYWTGGDAVPTREGEEAPRGGVVYWMERDEFFAVAAFAQLALGRFQLQIEYAQAEHDAVRDADVVMTFEDQPLSPDQRARYFVDGDPEEGLSPLGIKYTVRSFYARFSYELQVGETTTLTPYVFFDHYENPETIRGPEYGGGEAGLSDSGAFYKVTIGAALRPVAQVALKVDGALLDQRFNGEYVVYGLFRASLSYLWELPL